MGPKHLVHAAKCIDCMDQKAFGVTHVFSNLSKVINNGYKMGNNGYKMGKMDKKWVKTNITETGTNVLAVWTRSRLVSLMSSAI